MQPSEFLRVMKRIIREEQPVTPVRLGTVDEVAVDGLSATVQLDGETAAGGTYYPSVAYTPVAGDRVVLLRAGNSWTILGKVGSGGAVPTDPYVPSSVGARVELNSAFTAAISGTDTAVPWDAEDRDDAGFWSSSDPTRLTAPHDGWYVSSFMARWDTSTAGTYREIRISRTRAGNVLGFAGMQVGPPIARSWQNCGGPVYMLAGDYLEARVVHDSGSNRTISHTSDVTSFSIAALHVP